MSRQKDFGILDYLLDARQDFVRSIPEYTDITLDLIEAHIL